MLLKAPSKINLTLKILSKRADGYHEISSLMRAIRLFDELEVSLTLDDRSLYVSTNPVIASVAKQSSISITTNTLDIPKGQKNLAWQAADLVVKELAGGSISGRIGIHITKNIPIAAGLGGGSSDAAAVLLWAAKNLAPETKMPELVKLGAKIGADVPFCLYSCAMANPALGYEGASGALAEGIGEMITPVHEAEKAYVILVKPEIKVNTKDVYSLYDMVHDVGAAQAIDIIDADGDPRNGCPIPDNDLEYPCIKSWPIVAETIAKLKKICETEGAGKAKVQLTGSGPTVFAYFGEDAFGSAAQASAVRIHERAKAQFKDRFVHLTETL